MTPPKPSIAKTLAKAMRHAAKQHAKEMKPSTYPAPSPDKNEAPRPLRPHPHMIKRTWRDSTSGE